MNNKGIMKIKIVLTFCVSFFLLAFFSKPYAQVGIGTTSPKGILDIDSNIYGVVYPSVSLTSTILEAPVVNPNGGGLVLGTTIYNTNTTSTGSNDVEPGIYSWDGSKWIVHFYKRQSELFEQNTALRTSSNTGYVDVPGLGVSDSKTFTSNHSGLYKIEVKTNYGGGDMINNGDMNVAAAEGNFRFIFDGTSHIFSTKSFSTYNDHINSGTNYSNIWKESYITIYINLIEGSTYSFSLEFDQFPATGFVNSGNSGVGRGYVGEGIFCFIEFTYIDE